MPRPPPLQRAFRSALWFRRLRTTLEWSWQTPPGTAEVRRPIFLLCLFINVADLFQIIGEQNGTGYLFIIQVINMYSSRSYFNHLLKFPVALKSWNLVPWLVFKVIHSDSEHLVLRLYNSQKRFFCLLSGRETTFIFWTLKVLLIFDDLSKYMVVPVVRFRSFLNWMITSRTQVHCYILSIL